MSRNKAALSCSDGTTITVLMLIAIVGAIIFFTDVKEMVNTQQKLKSKDEISTTLKVDLPKEDQDQAGDAQNEQERKTPTAWFDLTLTDDTEKSKKGRRQL